MTTTFAAGLVLTLFNVGLFAWQVQRLRAALGDWRKILSSLPTPMLGFASSYGVYAYNLLFVPPWVAAVMAAAYETCYIGIAALDNLDDAQRKRGKRIMLAAASISFTQNAIAGLLHSVPELRAYISAWPMYARALLFGVGALLHAAQVWIALFAADFTLHRPAAQKLKSEPSVKTLAQQPVSIRRRFMAAKIVQYPPPERVNMTTPDSITAQNVHDPRVAEVRRLRDIDTLTYQQIALHLGLKSRQAAENLYKHGRTYAPRKTTDKGATQ